MDDLLAERKKRYGEFKDVAETSQELKNTLMAVAQKQEHFMDDDMCEALEMICHKMARIVNGDPWYADSWVDIAGYAQRVSERLEKL